MLGGEDLWNIVNVITNSILHSADKIKYFLEAIAVSIGLVMGALGLGWVRRFERSFEKAKDMHAAAFYSELDKMYSDLLRLALERPYLRSPQRVESDSAACASEYVAYPALAGTDEGRRLEDEYAIYAFMIWNFVETIHDRCETYPNLLGTWATIVAAENDIHRGWFIREMRNAHSAKGAEKFCKEFQVFVFDENFKPDVFGEYHRWNYDYCRAFRKPPNFG
jgi:hypothetical protein